MNNPDLSKEIDVYFDAQYKSAGAEEGKTHLNQFN